MLKYSFNVLCCFILFFGNPVFCQKDNFSKEELVVEFAKKPTEELKLFLFDEFLNLESLKEIGNKKVGKTFLLQFKSSVDVSTKTNQLIETGLFKYVEPNYKVKGHGYVQTPNDPLFINNQWSHLNDGSFSLSPATNDADIDTDLAWDITTGDPNLIVAVLDTGIKLDHPEFNGRIITGYNYVNDSSDPTDDHGHGTNVTGIALASGNNSIGYAGVNWNSKIMPLKILDNNNEGFYSWMADAIYYAVDNGAKVINLSAGGDSSSTLLEDAVNYAYSNNVPVIVSTGNQNSVIQYPAKYANAIAVGSTNPNDARSAPFFWSTTSGSNYGPEIDFVAPGNYIYGLNHLSNTSYDTYWGGTSQAAPHVAGVVSLLLSIKSNLTISQIVTILQETSQDMIGNSTEDTLGWDQYYGYGRINAFNALSHNVLTSTGFSNSLSKLVIYPNPINDSNFLFINGLLDNCKYLIQIISLDGKIIANDVHFNNSNIVKLNVTDLQSGVYLLRIKDFNKTEIVTKKIIKK